MIDQRRALAEVTGGLCYGLLRTFQATARAATSAPSLALAERQAAFAGDELERLRVLRARLDSLTQEPEAAMETYRASMDAFYDQSLPTSWLEAQIFHFVGDTLTTDFADILASRVDAETAAALRRALTGRTEQEAFALDQIREAMESKADAVELSVASYVGSFVGQALNRLRDTLLESDALETVLGEGAVKDVVLELLGRHRERLERLGLDTLE